MKDVILFLTHTWSPDIEAEFRALAAVEGTDAWILMDGRNPHRCFTDQYPNCRVFDLDSLLELPYSKLGPRSLCGNAHLPLLDFFNAHPHFANYWVVEYDVRYVGDWNRLVRRFGKYGEDFVTCHIRSRDEEPLWCWWDSFGHPDHALGDGDYWRSFNVMYRISARALRFLDHELRTGWHGHHEVLLISLLLRSGYSVLDFGGDGVFAPPGLRNRVYTSAHTQDGSLNAQEGTIGYRPIRITPGRLRNKLYHPVKPEDDLGGFAAFGRLDDGW